MLKTSSRLGDIACLNTADIPATLISTTGFHCKVWQCAAILVQGEEKIPLDYVIKKYNGPCSWPEVAVLNRDYREIKAALGEIIPTAVFVATRVEGLDSVIAIAEAIYPWFNLANPANEEEAIPLLGKMPKAQDQLERFLVAAERWHAPPNDKVIDLYGIDNLVLDRDRQIRYIDSFSVFFYEDLLDLCDEPDAELEQKIRISLQRKDYLGYLLRQSRQG